MSISTIEIFQGKQGKYYVLNGIKYDIHFPLHYAMNHDPEQSGCCGPEMCLNCLHFGAIRGVIVGYCGNCSTTLNNTRGEPIYQLQKFGDQEMDQEKFEEYLPHMKGVPLAEIGDEEEEWHYWDSYAHHISEAEAEEDYYDQYSYHDSEPEPEAEHEEEEEDYHSDGEDVDYDMIDYERPVDARRALDPIYQERHRAFHQQCREDRL